MKDIIISFPKDKKIIFTGSISEFSKDLATNIKKIDLDIEITESKIKYCNELYKDQKGIIVLLESKKLATTSENLVIKVRQEITTVINNYGISIQPNELNILNYWHILNDTPNCISNENKNESDNSNSDFDIEKRSKIYVPIEPNYTFDRVIINEDIKKEINNAIRKGQIHEKLFKEWGLIDIEPHPSTALNFYGEPGTGKTMAAEAVAKELHKKILKVSYADVESKYHGEGPKMVQAIFHAAEQNDAVLFFDEADSLLSKRLTNVSDGSAQAINSMRSELLIQLEKFEGIVIFATNLFENYDKAFRSRLQSINFKTPDETIRKKIWDVHLKPIEDGKEHNLRIPLDPNVNTEELAKKYNFVGREIRNTVINTCVNIALDGERKLVTQEDLIKECNRLNEEKKKAEEEELKAKKKEKEEEEAKERAHLELFREIFQENNAPKKSSKIKTQEKVLTEEIEQLNLKTENISVNIKNNKIDNASKNQPAKNSLFSKILKKKEKIGKKN